MELVDAGRFEWGGNRLDPWEICATANQKETAAQNTLENRPKSGAEK
jgi:hypothetical protein